MPEKTRKKSMNYKKIINNFITLCIFIAFPIFFYNNQEVFKSIDLDLIILIPILCLSITRYLINASIEIKLLENLNIKLKFSESLNLVVLNTIGNLVGPFKIGIGLKITYLKTKHNLSVYKNFVINGQYIVIHLLLSILLLLSTIVAFEKKYSEKVLLVLLFLIFLIIIFIIFIRNFDFEKVKPRLNKYIFDLISILNFNLIKKNIFSIFTLSVLHLFFGIINIFLIFSMLNFENMFKESIYFNLISILGSVTTVTPGNIGILEFLHVLFKELYSLSAAEIVLVSIISRLISLVSLFIINLYTRINKIELL